MSIQEIALIAHDRKKEEMVAFVQKHRDFFAQFTLVATGTPGQRIMEGTGLAVERLKSDPLGGDAEIAARVVNGDPLYAQPHEPDIRALLRICEVYNVPIATNLATAECVVRGFDAVRDA